MATNPNGLTSREIDVLDLVASGLATQAIAAELYLSPHTVKTHVKNAREKLGAGSRAQAVAIHLATLESAQPLLWSTTRYEFAAYREHGGGFRWRLDAGSHRVLARSGELYPDRDAAARAAERAREALGNAVLADGGPVRGRGS